MKISPLYPPDFARVLFPVDCTPESQRAVAQAARVFVGMHGARLLLVGTVAPLPEGLDAEATQRLKSARYQHANEALDQAAATLKQVGMYCRRVIREAPSIADALIDEATEKRDSDVIVLDASLATREIETPGAGECPETVVDHLLRKSELPVILMPRLRA